MSVDSADEEKEPLKKWTGSTDKRIYVSLCHENDL